MSVQKHDSGTTPEHPPFALAYENEPGGLPTGPVWDVMKARPDWLIWAAVWNEEKKKWDKPPRLPRRKGVVDRNKAAIFTFDEAVAHAQEETKKAARRGRVEIFGVSYFCRPDSPVRAGDLDDLDQPEKAKTLKALLELGETYIEKSPSGNGVRIWMKVPANANGEYDVGWAKAGYEFSGSEGKHFTFTGASIGDTREIREAPGSLDTLRQGYAAARGGSSTRKKERPEEDWDHYSGGLSSSDRSEQEMFDLHLAAMQNDRAYCDAVQGGDEERAKSNTFDRSTKLMQHAAAAKRLGWSINEWAFIVGRVWNIGRGHLDGQTKGNSNPYAPDGRDRALERAWNRCTVDSVQQKARRAEALRKMPELLKAAMEAAEAAGSTSEADDEVIDDEDDGVDLLRPPGAAGALVDWATSSGVTDNPSAALAGVLAGLSASMGNNYFARVYSATPTATMLWLLLLGGSGSGKENARRLVYTITQLAGHLSEHELVMLSDPASDAAVRQAVCPPGKIGSDNKTRARALVLMTDEIGRKLASAGKRHNGTGGRIHEIATLAMQVYGSGCQTLFSKVYANPKNTIPPLALPSMTCMNTSTEEEFWEAMEEADALGGYLPRHILIKGPATAESVEFDHAPEEMPEEIKQALARITGRIKHAEHIRLAAVTNAMQTEGMNAGVMVDAAEEATDGLMVELEGEHVIEVRPTTEARKLLDEFRVELNRMKSEIDEQGRALLNRALENAIRVATVIAVFNCPDNARAPEIGVAEADWAIRMIKDSTGTLRKEAKDRIADNIGDEIERKLLDLMWTEMVANKRAPKRKKNAAGVDPTFAADGWVRASTVKKRCRSRKWSGRDLTEIWKDMVDDGQIETVEVQHDQSGHLTDENDKMTRATLYARLTAKGVADHKDGLAQP